VTVSESAGSGNLTDEEDIESSTSLQERELVVQWASIVRSYLQLKKKKKDNDYG
jgi:hypothetical protein